MLRTGIECLLYVFGPVVLFSTSTSILECIRIQLYSCILNLQIVVQLYNQCTLETVRPCTPTMYGALILVPCTSTAVRIAEFTQLYLDTVCTKFSTPSKYSDQCTQL